MLNRHIIATGLLGAAATLAHAQDAAKKDPQTGKNCVTFMASEQTNTGQIRMQFRNTCDNAFQVVVETPVGNRTRKTAIEAGTADKPAKAYITCKSDERCEAAKWTFDTTASAPAVAGT